MCATVGKCPGYLQLTLNSLGFNTPGSFRQLPIEKLTDLFEKITTKIKLLAHPSSEIQQQLKIMIDNDLMHNYKMTVNTFELLWGHELYLTSVHKHCMEICEPFPVINESEITAAGSSIVASHYDEKIGKKSLSELTATAKKHVDQSVHASWKGHEIRQINVDINDNCLKISCCYCLIVVKACDQKFSNFIRHLSTAHGHQWNEKNSTKRPRSEFNLQIPSTSQAGSNSENSIIFKAKAKAKHEAEKFGMDCEVEYIANFKSNSGQDVEIYEESDEEDDTENDDFLGVENDEVNLELLDADEFESEKFITMDNIELTNEISSK